MNDRKKFLVTTTAKTVGDFTIGAKLAQGPHLIHLQSKLAHLFWCFQESFWSILSLKTEEHSH